MLTAARDIVRMLWPALEARTEAKGGESCPRTEGPWVGAESPQRVSKAVWTDQVPGDFAQCSAH